MAGAALPADLGGIFHPQRRQNSVPEGRCLTSTVRKLRRPVHQVVMASCATMCCFQEEVFRQHVSLRPQGCLTGTPPLCGSALQSGITDLYLQKGDETDV